MQQRDHRQLDLFGGHAHPHRSQIGFVVGALRVRPEQAKSLSCNLAVERLLALYWNDLDGAAPVGVQH